MGWAHAAPEGCVAPAACARARNVLQSGAAEQQSDLLYCQAVPDTSVVPPQLWLLGSCGPYGPYDRTCVEACWPSIRAVASPRPIGPGGRALFTSLYDPAL